MKRLWIAAGLLAAFAFVPGNGVTAQMPPISDDKGLVGMGLILRQLKTTAVFAKATAHPDDENSPVLAALGLGQGVRTAVVSATRGNGGQNEIGPELFEPMAVLRTEELVSVHQIDGAEQYFLRAIDFGYSFSIEETFQKWGKQEILSDFVRMFRTIRPDVIVAMRPDGAGGGQHHQASAVISREAFLAAGDPGKFPEQLKEGLRPWQPKKFYFTGRYGFPGEPPPPPGIRLTPVDHSAFDPLLGETYTEIGSRARSNHKSQGMAQLLSLPGSASAGFQLVETAIAGLKEKGEVSLFDGIDTTLAGLARFVPGEVPSALTTGLASISAQVTAADQQFASGGLPAAVAPLASGLSAVRSLRSQLRSGAFSIPSDARDEIDSRLNLKERQFSAGLLMAGSVRVDALSDDGVVVAGQPVKLSLIIANRGASSIGVRQIQLRGFEGDSGPCGPGNLAAGAVSRCEVAMQVSRQARLTGPYWKPLPDAARYQFEADAPFGLPFRPTPFRAEIELEICGVVVPVDQPVQFRYEGNIFSGEKRMELQVVPRFSVKLSPAVAIMPRGFAQAGVASPASRPGFGRELRVTVVNSNKGPAEGNVSLEMPEGWKATPATAPVTFTREDEAQTVRFTVIPAAAAKPGTYSIHAIMHAGTASFSDGYQVIEYPHTRRRHIIQSAETAFQVLNVAVAPALNVGYIMGVGDQVPQAIEQLGARVTLLDSDALAWGDLSRFDCIVTGIRAYERRSDLRADNQHLLDYAHRGGTVIIQYNKMEFNEAQYGPYPARVSSTRVTDENAPVTILVPAHPVFNVPNKIGASTWSGWVQERGLYFLGDRDPRYVDLLQFEEPFEYNKGIKKGALVEAQVGKGRWLYCGIGLWRQVITGTPGAYELLANLISLGRTKTIPVKLTAPAQSKK